MEMLHIQEYPHVLSNVAPLVFLMLGYWFPKCGPGTSRGPWQNGSSKQIEFFVWDIDTQIICDDWKFITFFSNKIIKLCKYILAAKN